MPTFLHIGCGPKRKEQTTRGFNTADWNELRLDIDASVAPDITGTMTDMSALADASVDAIFSSHNIEHLYPHEVPVALAEFKRVLKPDGFAVITCPCRSDRTPRHSLRPPAGAGPRQSLHGAPLWLYPETAHRDAAGGRICGRGEPQARASGL